MEVKFVAMCINIFFKVCNESIYFQAPGSNTCFLLSKTIAQIISVAIFIDSIYGQWEIVEEDCLRETWIEAITLITTLLYSTYCLFQKVPQVKIKEKESV